MRKSGAIRAIEQLPAGGLAIQDDTSEWMAGDIRYQWVGLRRGQLVLCRTITITHDNGELPWVVMSYWDDAYNDWFAVNGLQQVEGSSVSSTDELVTAQLELDNVYRISPGADHEPLWPKRDITAEEVVAGAFKYFWVAPEEPPVTANFQSFDDTWAA